MTEAYVDRAVRVRPRNPETDGLVPDPVASNLLQPWEVWGQDRFDLEMIRIFARSWLWLGDLEDLQQPGDFITGTIGKRLFSRIYGLDTSAEVQDAAFEHLEQTNLEDTEMLQILMDNLRSPFCRVGPASTWEVRATHLWETLRHQLDTPLAPDEFA